MSVVVTGIGGLNALGDLVTSWERLLALESGIRTHQPFRQLPPFPLAQVGETPMRLPQLTRQVVAATLKDAGLTPPLLDCAVVVGSSRSCQGDWEAIARSHNLSSPAWLDTLPNRGATLTARLVGTTGIVLAPMAACATGIGAIAQAYELIASGQCQQAIAGAVEAPITPLTLAGFERMGAIAKTGCYPFDRQREGLVLGEGGALFVLESAEVAHRRGASCYGEVLGFGLTCDAYHLNAPDPSGKSAIAAVQRCLSRAGLCPKDINYIHAHGTSTKLNDSTEAALIQTLFPDGVAVSSTKGATGHTLGASGAIGMAFCLMALKHQVLPPCVGLKSPEFNLDFVTLPRRTSVERVLCFSFGFGGQNAAIALKN